MWGLTILESVDVTPATAERYGKEIDVWLSTADVVGEGLVWDADIDTRLVRRFNVLYRAGHPPSRGEVTLAGLMHYAAEFSRGGHRLLPRAWRALKGWRRRCPPRSRRPHALGVWSALAWEMARDKHLLLGIYGALILSTLMEAIFPFAYGVFLKALRTAWRRLGVDVVAYQARHSGPSIDAARHLRSRSEIKSRGR